MKQAPATNGAPAAAPATSGVVVPPAADCSCVSCVRSRAERIDETDRLEYALVILAEQSIQQRKDLLLRVLGIKYGFGEGEGFDPNTGRLLRGKADD